MSGINEQVINAEIYQIGPQGIPGEAATISIGTVTTGAAGSDASVTNSGTSSAAVLDFVIPQGAQGLQGIQGPQGIQGLTGATGNGIASIVKTGTVGLVDTYRITFTDNTYFDFDVTNGSSISDIEKTGTSGLVDTYTITLTNGDTHTFTVTNGAQGEKGETGEVGNGVLGVTKMSTTGLVDNYRMTFTNGTYFDFDVANAKSIVSISKISTSGLIDTYRITFNDNTNFQFPISNGNGVAGVTLLSWEGLDKTYRMTFTNGTYFDFTVSNGAEGQAEWGGISGVLSNQHDLQDALDAKADVSQTHALKSYSDNGELLTDAEGLADVTNYAHSTFDLSKFTVVGSPTITDDGIASEFSSANYLQTTSITLGSGDFDIYVPVKFTSALSNYTNGRILTQDDKIRIMPYNGTLAVAIIATDNSNIISSNFVPTINTEYLIHLYKAGTTYGAEYSSDNGLNWTNISQVTSDKQVYYYNTAKEFKLGNNIAGGDIEIDLKQFSITVDGVPVFSGNKTGIDTIKPDDYTVVGTPTISADGVASGFSASNYVKKSGTFYKGANAFKIEFNIVTPSQSSQGFSAVLANSSIRGAQFVYIPSNKNACWFLSSDGASWDIASYGLLKNLEYNTPYRITLEKTATQYIATYYNLNTATSQTAEITNSASINSNISDIILGVSREFSTIEAFPGSIDLNSFKIYVDGNLVYQPCLKIPYIESKTGSKIVNSIYRDRVNDMAEQFGYANYYTLSDTDFTLPQVELYGLIGDKTLRDSYYNGVTYWELFSNRRLEQGGTCESGVEYTLPKPFADANYVLTIPYSSKTATSFIPSATGDFIAKGTGLL